MPGGPMLGGGVTTCGPDDREERKVDERPGEGRLKRRDAVLGVDGLGL